MDPIFRSIEVDEGQQITLGAPIPDDVMKDMDKTGPNTYTMKSGTYGGAESISVEVNAEQLVQRIDFGYKKGTDYDALRANFIGELGPPLEGAAAIPDAQQQTVWQDAQTRFALFASGHGARTRVGSTLTDLVSTPA